MEFHIKMFGQVPDPDAIEHAIGTLDPSVLVDVDPSGQTLLRCGAPHQQSIWLFLHESLPTLLLRRASMLLSEALNKSPSPRARSVGNSAGPGLKPRLPIDTRTCRVCGRVTTKAPLQTDVASRLG